MFRLTFALGLASAASLATAATTAVSTLDPGSPWSERVTVTIGGDGQPQACRFESSRSPESNQDCQVQASQAAMAKTSTGSKDSYTRITFERRFSPSWQPAAYEPPSGDMLLGRQVMSLAIGAKGAVEGCQVVSSSGDMKPDYGCKEVSSEHFTASAAAAPGTRQGYLTILVYGHSEHVV